MSDEYYSHSARIRVAPRILTGATATALHTSTAIGTAVSRVEPNKRVFVEAHPHNINATVLYASEALGRLQTDPFSETEFVTINPTLHNATMVRQNHAYEICVLGMSISPDDLHSSRSKLLMYSSRTDIESPEDAHQATPYVHYDPTIDSPNASIQPDTFLPIPASKSLYYSSTSTSDISSRIRKCLFVHFKISQVDDLTDSKSRTLATLSQLAEHASEFKTPTSTLGLLSPPFQLASSIGQRALRSYVRKDSVMAIDFKFLLAGCDESDHEMESDLCEHGDYLRYGYYFFLKKAVDAKLYASTRTSDQHVTLMLRRSDSPMGEEKEYFALTGVSYLVVKVSPRTERGRQMGTRRAIGVGQAQRVEELLRMSVRAGSNVSKRDAMLIREKLKALAKELGVVL